jgi:hypothetical protein
LASLFFVAFFFYHPLLPRNERICKVGECSLTSNPLLPSFSSETKFLQDRNCSWPVSEIHHSCAI